MNLRERVDALERRVEQLERLLAAPVLPLRHDDGRIRYRRFPKFWYDQPVRETVLALHRRLTVNAALAQLVSEFGSERAPSRTALHRCWQRLDRAGVGDPSHSRGNDRA